MNEISEVDEGNAHMGVDTDELENFLHDAIREDPDYKTLEELEHQGYLLPRDHYKRLNKDSDVAIINDYLQDKTEVDFRSRIRMSKRGLMAVYNEI